MKRQPRIADLTDDALLCFVQWARACPAEVMLTPGVCRRVLLAYAGAGLAEIERTVPVPQVQS